MRSNDISWCPVESAAPGGCGAPNQFTSQPQVSCLVGHLPQVSYIYLIGQLQKGRWWWNGEGRHQGAVQQISWHLLYNWGNPWKASVRKRLGAHSSETSHCFKWGSFPPNEVGRATLPALLAKPIGSGYCDGLFISCLISPRIRIRPTSNLDWKNFETLT